MPLRNSPRTIVVALLLGGLVFVVGHFSDLLLMSGHSRLAILDDAAFAVATVAGVMLYDRWRQRRIRDKLWLISEMNHHVRNQLQIIQYSAYATGDRELFTRMQESVARIDWALREILGKPADDGAVPEPPRANSVAPPTGGPAPRR